MKTENWRWKCWKSRIMNEERRTEMNNWILGTKSYQLGNNIQSLTAKTNRNCMTQNS